MSYELWIMDVTVMLEAAGSTCTQHNLKRGT